jgi:chromosome partitioning protein
LNIVSIVNQKGGVAKTTSTASIGACLAAKGLRTLLIDLDPQANLTLGLSGSWTDLPYRLPDVLLNSALAPLSGIVRQVGESPLFLVPGHLEIAKSEATLMRQEAPAYNLRNAIQSMVKTQPFDWILIDCPPSLGVLTQNALVASNYLLVPTEPKMYAFAGMDTLNQMIVWLAETYKFRIRLLGVLLTMYERRTRIHTTIAEVIRERFGDAVFKTIIYRNVKISEAELEGKSILEFDRTSRGAANYVSVTEEILLRAGK